MQGTMRNYMQRTIRILIDSILHTYHEYFILILVHFYFTIVLIVSVGTTRLPSTSLGPHLQLVPSLPHSTSPAIGGGSRQLEIPHHYQCLVLLLELMIPCFCSYMLRSLCTLTCSAYWHLTALLPLGVCAGVTLHGEA